MLSIHSKVATTLLESALGQFFDMPITYNAGIAKALDSTKSAIMFDYLFMHESHALKIPELKVIAHDIGLGAFESQTAYNKLLHHNLIQRDEEGDIAVNPFYINELNLIFRKQKIADYENLLTSIAINRLYMRTILNQGGSVNAGILLSIVHGSFDEWQLNTNKQYSEWISLNDDGWMNAAGMSIKEYKQAKNVLYRLGYIDKCRVGFPSTTKVRLDLAMLANKTWEFATGGNKNDSTVATLEQVYA